MATLTPALAPPDAARRRLRLSRRREDGLPKAALGWVVLIVVTAVAAPVVARHDPSAQELTNRFAAASSDHWFGTDELGRDVFARVLHGGRVSLHAAALSLGVAVVIGIPLGLLAGYRRGVASAIMSRVNDAIMSLPPLLLALALIGILGPGLSNAMLAIGVVAAPRFFRVARAAAMSIRPLAYIDAASIAGQSTPSILVGHVLPNTAGPLLVQASFAMGYAIVAEASLSFLGLGVQPPKSSWGSMVKDAFDALTANPTGIYPPAVCMFLTIWAFSALGDAMRDRVARSTGDQLGARR